ncbi:uncharacterized protein BX663DRAFT_522182 [Cokeromyces recurvatus]|uniref:uncharacterized protein n=1 Tax=Cokeromyces recurvatus TaxID=90255 RepID=UPI00221F40D6|nr:uncharacterized protein BX663DRAFT_522182 [Cokeromyces recurvatus]KAI7899318.1 hypothetical protein BX663DRAFT_522182 [Cokeromyces recurvatus]
MSYFQETNHKNWDLVEAIESKLTINWKHDWTRITRECLLKLNPEASSSSSFQPS